MLVICASFVIYPSLVFILHLWTETVVICRMMFAVIFGMFHYTDCTGTVHEMTCCDGCFFLVACIPCNYVYLLYYDCICYCFFLFFTDICIRCVVLTCAKYVIMLPLPIMSAELDISYCCDVVSLKCIFSC